MPQPRLTDPPASTLSLDPAYDALTPDEQAQAWWRGTDDEDAVRAGDDVEWAHDEYFPSGLGRSRLKDEDWARVAYFIAAGVSTTEVAKHFGVSRSTIWRGMQRSSGLRHRVQAERRMFQRESDNRFVALRHAVVDGLQHAISAGNVRVLLWAADRLDLGGTILPQKERLPVRRPIPRPRRAPAAVREILAAAHEQGTALPPDPAPAPVPGLPPLVEITVDMAAAPGTPPPAIPSRPDADTPAPEPATPEATLAPATPQPDPPAGPLPDAPDGTAPPPAIILAPRRVRERVRALLATGRKPRPPFPQLADNVDWKETEALVIHSRCHGLPRLVCDTAEPLNPYRPLRRYRWP